MNYTETKRKKTLPTDETKQDASNFSKQVKKNFNKNSLPKKTLLQVTQPSIFLVGDNKEQATECTTRNKEQSCATVDQILFIIIITEQVLRNHLC